MILGLVEHDGGAPNELSLQMLTLARGLAERAGAAIGAVVVGPEGSALAPRLGRYGVSTVHLAGGEGLIDYAPGAWARCVADVVDRARPGAVLAAGTDRGHEVLARVGALLDLPLAANCIAVEPGDPYLVIRQRWGGTLLEEARLHGAVKLLTTAPHATPVEEALEPPTVTVGEFTPSIQERDLRVRATGRVERQAGRIPLAEARVVVGGGRGVGGAEGFELLEELAGLLGGAVGCSRAVTSAGWRPHVDQIGQTGARISPELYIACGISGASQHMVGCKGAKRILAINTDPEAPIMTQADYAIVADLRQVARALIDGIRKSRQGRP